MTWVRRIWYAIKWIVQVVSLYKVIKKLIGGNKDG